MTARDKKLLQGIFSYEDNEQALKTLIFEAMSATSVTVSELHVALGRMRKIISNTNTPKKKQSMV